MDKETYDAQIKDLNITHRNNLCDLMKKYAAECSSKKIGGVFTDHIGSIKVESIGFDNFSQYPSATYYGLELTKKLVPKKSGESRRACQCNEVKLK